MSWFRRICLETKQHIYIPNEDIEMVEDSFNSEEDFISFMSSNHPDWLYTGEPKRPTDLISFLYKEY